MISTPVHDVLTQATIPAQRPIDHLRRCGSGMFLGNCLGMVAGVVAYGNTIAVTQLAIMGVLLLGLSAIFLSPWLVRDKATNEGIPVVARSLPTDEAVKSRLARFGLRVPVVAQPVAGGPSFRSFVTLKADENHTDPTPGTLYAMRQIEEGCGELAPIAQPTAEQLALLDRLLKHPKELNNAAKILPHHKSPLDPSPWWSAAIMAASVIAGIVLAIAVVKGIAG